MEAEYVAVSEVVIEIKFLYHPLMSMGVKVPILIKIKVDNMGAIWFANNRGVSKRIKHQSMLHLIIVIDEIVTIDFVKSVENTSDLMTKNQQSVHFKSAQPKLVYMVKDIEDEMTEKHVKFGINEQEGC